MNYFKYIFLGITVLFFVGCSSKNQVSFNKQLQSISLNETIIVARPAQTVKSPVSLNLGLGGYISKHVGIHVGSSVRPDIKNSEGLNFQRALEKFDISLGDKIKTSFKRKMSEDSFYKNRFVPFGSDTIINLYVKKYEIDESFFSRNAYMKIYMQVRVVNTNGQELYINELVNETNISQKSYSLSDVFVNKRAFLQLLESSINNLVYKHIESMKQE